MLIKVAKKICSTKNMLISQAGFKLPSLKPVFFCTFAALLFFNSDNEEKTHSNNTLISYTL